MNQDATRMSEPLWSSLSGHSDLFPSRTAGSNQPRAWSGVSPNGTAIQPEQTQTPGSSRSGSINLDRTLDSPAGTSKTSAKGPRIRVSKACTPCRRVKLKCNGETPCGRCSALNLPMDDCIYPPSLRGKTRRKKMEIEADRTSHDIADTSREESLKRSKPNIEGQRDTRQWDAGWTMSSMKEDFAKWKHDENLTVHGPRNDHIWRHAHSSLHGGQSAPTANSGPLAPAGPSPRQELPDQYTTSNILAEEHNPLGVLAEASATAGNAATSPSPYQHRRGPGEQPEGENGKGEEEESGYYVPLDRVLKKDAPHIMSLISISE